MVEADPHQAPVSGRGFGKSRQFGRAARRRRLDQDVLAIADRAMCNFRKGVVQSCDYHDRDRGIADGLFPIVHSFAANNGCSQPIGSFLHNVGTDHKARSAQGLGSLLADQATANYCNTQIAIHRSPHSLFLSRPVMRRRV
jgi:hypothetical protein